MAAMTRWVDRRFGYEPPAGEYRMILERLRGTPARAEERIGKISKALLTRKAGDAWSIQEHVGHLLDLESLWATRVDEFFAGAKELSAADMSNARTYAANHNSRLIQDLVKAFRATREALVARLDAASNEDIERASFHPRLKRSMRLIDLCFFVAEHDDHHLAIVTQLLREGQ